MSTAGWLLVVCFLLAQILPWWAVILIVPGLLLLGMANQLRIELLKRLDACRTRGAPK